MSNFWNKLIFFVLISNFIFNENSYAYVGLGPLIPILGNIIVYIFLAIVAFLGIIIYPLKITFNKLKNKKKKNTNIKNKT